ncbi:MAG: hypothetical protein KDN20_01775 [Verrucomicrobiae bacterium]|nr:hypothetical protein [Verrucomicrobiae bacterium]
MAIDYTIDPEANLIRVNQVGSFSIAEMIRHSLRVNEDPAFVPGMNTLTDLRKASLMDEVAAIRKYVDHSAELAEIRGACKWACLVADESALNLIWSFDLVMRERGIPIRTKAFLDEAEALAWLAE